MSVRHANVLSRRVRSPMPDLALSGAANEIRKEPGPLPPDRSDALLELFSEKLATSILAELPSFRHTRATQSRATIARYLRSLEIVEWHVRALGTFLQMLFRSLIQVGVSQSTPALWHQEAVDELYGLIADKLRYWLELPTSILTADLVATGVKELEEAVRSDLKQRAALLSGHVCRVLVDGVRGGMLGVAKWPSPTTCRFTHYRFNVLLQNATRHEVTAGYASIQETYRHEVWQSEVHLIDATLFRGVPSWLLAPTFLEGALSALPDFLRPFVGTIDGRLIRERIQTWEVMETSHVKEIEIPLSRPKVDPAVTIGNIVLCGWTPRDFPSRGNLARQTVGRVWRAVDYLQAGFERDAEEGEVLR